MTDLVGKKEKYIQGLLDQSLFLKADKLFFTGEGDWPFLYRLDVEFLK
jgi:hypothetical protein